MCALALSFLWVQAGEASSEDPFFNQVANKFDFPPILCEIATCENISSEFPRPTFTSDSRLLIHGKNVPILFPDTFFPKTGSNQCIKQVYRLVFLLSSFDDRAIISSKFIVVASAESEEGETVCSADWPSFLNGVGATSRDVRKRQIRRYSQIQSDTERPRESV